MKTLPDISNYRRHWIYEEKVEILEVLTIGGWGVGRGEVRNLFAFAFCEVEAWHNQGDVYSLDAFMDFAAEAPIYYFTCYQNAEQFAKTKSNRYPIERRLWWLRYQEEYWFATIFNYYVDTIRYLSSTERAEYLAQLIRDSKF